MSNELENLELSEISLVGSGDNKNAEIVFFKTKKEVKKMNEEEMKALVDMLVAKSFNRCSRRSNGFCSRD